MKHVLRCEEVNESVCRQIAHNLMTECFGFSPDPSEIEDIDHCLAAVSPRHEKLQVTFKVKKVRYELLIMADPLDKTEYTADVRIYDFWGEGHDLNIGHKFHINTPLGISF